MGDGMSAPHLLVANVHFAPYTYGGATVVAEEVSRHLAQHHGYRISALSTCQRPDLAPYALLKVEREGIANYLINLPPHRSPAQLYDNPEATERVLELLRALGPDMVHAHCLQELGAGVLEAAEMAHLPAILSVHDHWWICERQFMLRADHRPCDGPPGPELCRGCTPSMPGLEMRRRRLARLAGTALAVTYPSRFALNLGEAAGLAPGQGRLWCNGVHLPGRGFFRAQAARRRRDPRITFGYLGGPSYLKGWPLLRAALRGLGREDFRLRLADGSRDGSWWRHEHLRGLPGDWAVCPRYDQADLDQFYAELDVLVFPSQWRETFGLALREALARGIGLIQTDCGGGVEHGAILPEALIPLGAGPEPLRAQMAEVLERGQVSRPPLPVRSFAEQAAELDAMLREELLPQRTLS